MQLWPRRKAGKRAGRLDPAMLAVRSAAVDAQRSRVPQMAAALAYRTLFGILPVAFVGLLIVRQFVPPETQTEIISRALDYAGLSNITVPRPVPPPDFVGPPRHAIRGDMGVAEWIQRLISHADSRISVRAMGIVGIITLIYAALSMLVEIELAFNQIYKVPKGRNWVQRLANYWTLLTLGTAGLVSTFYVGIRLTGLAKTFLAEHAQRSSLIANSEYVTATLVAYSVTVCITTLLLTVVYKAVPNTRVKFWPALAGAIIAAVAFEAGKWGFSQYIHYSSSYARLYGSIALIPLFMLWVYVTWLIVLFGLQIAYQLQYGLKKLRAMPILDVGPTLVEPGSALAIAAALARRFQTGTPATAQDIVKATGLGEGVVELVLAGLCEHGVAYRLDSAQDGTAESDVSYPLTRPATQIPARDVLKVGFELSTPETAKAHAADSTLASLRQAQVQAMGNQSLAQVAGLDGAAAPPAGVPLATPAQTEVSSATIAQNRPKQEPAQ